MNFELPQRSALRYCSWPAWRRHRAAPPRKMPQPSYRIWAARRSRSSVPEFRRPSVLPIFRRLFDSDLDLPDAARFVLGPNARVLTPEQNQEFLTLFREYLAQAYSKRLAEYGGEPFRVTGSRPNGEKTIVTSQVIRRNAAPLEIDWHVINRDGRWQIADVYVDGVSMKVSQRQEFASIIQRNGGRPDALLPVLRQQLGEAQVHPERSGSSSEPMPAPSVTYNPQH